MEKAKISVTQLFVLIVLFELGSAMLVPLAIEAKQEAWLAILIGTAGGLCLFLIYYGLYRYYPGLSPAVYVPKITGHILGRILVFSYVLYFVYLSARVLRDFGEMLIIFAYLETPLFVLNTLMMLLVIYTVRKGIEVLARTGELLFVVLGFLFVSAFLLIFISGIIQVQHLKPVLEGGIEPVIKTAFTQTLYFPFGEVVAFVLILPYVNEPTKVKRTGLLAIGVSGLTLAIIMALNTSVLGVELVSRSLFPLLSTIQSIEVADFLERLDVYFMLATVIGGFFKISLFFYVSVSSAASLFKVKEPIQLAYPLGIVVLLVSMMIASNFSEHLQEGIDIVPVYVHLPFQVIVPALLLMIAYFRNRKKSAQE